MEFYIARQPFFTRRRDVCGYKLHLCKSLRDYYYDLYSEPDDAEELYRQLCFAGYDETPEKPSAIMEYSYEMLESLVPLLPRNHVIVEFGSGNGSEPVDGKDIKKLRSQGYRVSVDTTANFEASLMGTIDIAKIDFSVLPLESQFERIKSGKGKIRFMASRIDTWEDYKKALVIGYDYFQGSFYLRPLPGKTGTIKSFSPAVLRIISEIGEREPSFRDITRIIEHDLNLSYRLLKYVNSAYFAPKFRIKTISQAVTMLGLNELSQFFSTLLIKEMQSPENTELLRLSLIRGKMMELLAGQKNLPQKGSEAFFTGIFSLIDILLNRTMAEILEELPLTDAVKEALTGESNKLKALLDLIKAYERADWEQFENDYKPDLIEQEKLMTSCIAALKWAEALDI